ncbi:MAG: hypothetical protein Q4A78_13085, partial [Peptostreptococcaceae bacterium]|nr:hypothetical protein [Peptostreptococcaceae bacterium]
MKFQKNQQDADFRAKATGRRFELDLDFRRVSPIFPKENPRRRMIFEVCLQSAVRNLFCLWKFFKKNLTKGKIRAIYKYMSSRRADIRAQTEQMNLDNRIVKPKYS